MADISCLVWSGLPFVFYGSTPVVATDELRNLRIVAVGHYAARFPRNDDLP